jgi:hypothetical protein
MNHRSATKESTRELVAGITSQSDFDKEWSNFARELLTIPYSGKTLLGTA